MRDFLIRVIVGIGATVIILAPVAQLPLFLSESKSEQTLQVISPIRFKCENIQRSSFIEMVCYDQRLKYMLLKLSGRSYHYCQIELATMQSFLAAESMGKFYNNHIKGRQTLRPYDCRSSSTPI